MGFTYDDVKGIIKAFYGEDADYRAGCLALEICQGMSDNVILISMASTIVAMLSDRMDKTMNEILGIMALAIINSEG